MLNQENSKVFAAILGQSQAAAQENVFCQSLKRGNLIFAPAHAELISATTETVNHFCSSFDDALLWSFLTHYHTHLV